MLDLFLNSNNNVLWGINMNGLVVVSIIINTILVVILGSSGEYPPFLVGMMGVFLGLSILGAIISVAGAKKPGAVLIIIGCILFIPIGAIGIFGARKILDAAKEAEFNNQVGV